jgi:hypothetical protein
MTGDPSHESSTSYEDAVAEAAAQAADDADYEDANTDSD